MFNYIKGRVAELQPGAVVLENGGIGFEIRVPDNSVVYMASPGEELRLYIAMIVREDEVNLYGFPEKNALAAFRRLMTVGGVGAKAALSVLSVFSVAELHQAIAFEDIAALTRANGVGKKTAQRIVLELKDKIDALEGVISLPEIDAASGNAREEAVNALMSLGYTKTEAMTAMTGITEPGLSVEEYIKRALTQR